MAFPATTTTTTLLEVVESSPPITESPVVEEPILCPRYSHPRHHSSCEEPVSQEELATVAHSHTAPSSGGGSSESNVAGCIRKYESGGTTDTNGSNDHRDGYYQIIPSTWGGYGGYSTAQEAPKSVQDERFNQLWTEGGHQHWAAQSGRCF